MIEVKTLNGHLNLDDSQYRLPKNDYIEALNISKDAIEGSNDNIITPIIANRVGDSGFVMPEGRNVCIGAAENKLRGTVIQCIWNENNYHLLLEFNLNERVQTPIFRNLTDSNNVDILGFTERGKITSINIYNRDEGDLLLFLDSLGRPTYLDIEMFKNGAYTPVTRDIIDLATLQPLSPPESVYGNDTSQRVNYTRKRFFRFQYRWADYTNRKTTFSPRSEVPLPIGFLSDAINSIPTNNNVINITLNSGGKDIKTIELGMSYVDGTNNWSDLLSVVVIDKVKEGIPDNVTFNYAFYNDSTYPAINIKDSILLYDYIPHTAKAEVLANGNVVVLSGVDEGYDNDIVPYVVNTVTTYTVTSPSSGNLTQITTYENDNPFTYQARTIFAGVPAVGTTVEITVKQQSDSTYVRGAFYTTQAGDTTAQVVAGLIASFGTYSRLFLSSSNSTRVTYIWSQGTYFKDIVVNIVAPTSALSANSIPTWLWSSQRSIGIAYYDKKGVTNGVIYNAKITFPAYSNDGSGNVNLPTINTKIYHRPPDWAYSFQFLFTKDGTVYLYWATNSVNIDEADYIYFEVTDFVANQTKFPTTATNLSYTFQDGDRMKLIKPIGNNTYFTDDYDAAILGLVVDPSIDGVVQTDKRFIKIKKVAPFTNATFTPNLANYEILIYRPVQQSANEQNQVYYEIGRQYEILNPETPERVHAGEVTDQLPDLSVPAEFNFTKGDSYYRQRIIALDDTTTILFNVEDRNIIDDYASAVSSIDGRPNQIDINAKRAFYGATFRHGQAYQPNTNINGLNRFYPEDFIDGDSSFGIVERMAVRDRAIRFFQTLKIGFIPIFGQINKGAGGTTVNVVTDKLLNPVQYYSGNFGIGNCKESLASFNFADYGCDDIRGIMWRVSNDGVSPISVLYKVNSWASQQLPLRSGLSKIYGVFDQKLNNYIASLEAVVCTPVGLPIITLPNGILEETYSYSVVSTGSFPLKLTDVVKPDWMSITVSGHRITFSGTPDVVGEGLEVSFTLTNECGEAESGLLTFNILEMQTGTIDLWGGLSTTVPDGWLLCNGAAVSRTTYAALFTAVGTIWGVGDGTTTFNLPNIGKKIVAGYDAGDAGYNTVGGIGGDNTLTLTDQHIAHKHTYDKYTNGSGTDGDSGPSDFQYNPTDTSSIGNTAVARTEIDLRNEYIVVPYKIKT